MAAYNLTLSLSFYSCACSGGSPELDGYVPPTKPDGNYHLPASTAGNWASCEAWSSVSQYMVFRLNYLTSFLMFAQNGFGINIVPRIKPQ